MLLLNKNDEIKNEDNDLEYFKNRYPRSKYIKNDKSNTIDLMYDYNDKICSIPVQITGIIFSSYDYNHDMCDIPNHITKIQLNNAGYHSLNNLSGSIENLNINLNFNLNTELNFILINKTEHISDKLLCNNLPNSIKKLTITLNINKVCFNSLCNKLPNSLIKLTIIIVIININHEITNIIPENLPVSLKKIIFIIKYHNLNESFLDITDNYLSKITNYFTITNYTTNYNNNFDAREIICITYEKK